eukprot:ANDGO_00383.mRNA.1 Eukaryotic translation initiation factor 3 subunit B
MSTFNEEKFIFNEPEVQLNTDFSNCVLIDNVPVVGQDKLSKLSAALSKTFSKVISKIPEDAKFIPVDAQGNTRGFMFIELPDKASADRFREKMDGHKFDTKHTFRVISVAELVDLRSMTDEVPEFSVPEYAAGERAHLRDHLTDKRAREQFLIRVGAKSELYWKDNVLQSKLVASKEDWTSDRRDVIFSPLGTYAATFHMQGIAVHGGPNMERIQRFKHERSDQVPNLAAFSPSETFLMTWSNYPADRKDEPGKVRIWDVSTGIEACAGFDNVVVYPSDAGPNAEPSNWPAFKWSHNDEYLARIEEGQLAIYETRGFKLLGGSRIAIDRLVDFQWSPHKNILVYWVAESGNIPARITLMAVPDRAELQKKTIFNVEKLRAIWHPHGDLLGMIAEKTPASGLPTTLEVFRMNHKGIPVESIALDSKEHLVDFAFEPNSTADRFAVSFTVEGLPTTRTNVRVYAIEKDKLKVVGTLEKKVCNVLLWSPRGRFLALCGLWRPYDNPKFQGYVEFIDVQGEGKSSPPLSTTGQAEHVFMDTATWDPSGRYFAAAVTFHNRQGENGFTIYNARGRALDQLKKDAFWQFTWRPRPPLMLSADEIAKVKASLKDRTAKYRKEDDALSHNLSEEEIAKRRELTEEFTKWQRKWAEGTMRYHSELRRANILRESDADEWVEDTRVEETVVEEQTERIE